MTFIRKMKSKSNIIWKSKVQIKKAETECVLRFGLFCSQLFLNLILEREKEEKPPFRPNCLSLFSNALPKVF
jgi:hypothetical protein